MIAATPLLAFGFSAPHSSPPLCEPGVDMPGGDLSPTPIEASAEKCHELCTANASCTLFSWHSHGECDPNGCALAGGCCRLKGVEVNGVAPKSDKCACSGYVRVPSSTFVPSGTPGPSAKNVLYILVDDLRPELAAYNQTKGHSPNISALAAGGTVFDNAYCQIAVCSPSRMSFLTGRRPDHSRVVNFIDHFRQADCGLNEGGVAYHGETFKSVKIGGCEWAGAAPCGGSGDCCSICSEHEGCAFWSYAHANSSCMLKTRRGDAAADEGVVSGARGSFGTRASWVSLPQHFRNAGWLALSSGKIFHTEEGGSGNVRPELNGPGMPPNEDPPSWSDGLSMQRVNDVANMWPCDMDSPTSSPDACAVDADVDGFVAHPTTTKALCDRVIADDAVLKLRLAAANLERTQQPFFMAAGFRKPHLAFRFPAPFLQLVAGDVAAHGALSATAPPIAHHDADPQPDPYTPIDAALASKWRQHYRAAIAWVDSQIGRVLAELEARQLVPSTLVALHSDHGWSLGEHGEWQKFSNFEHGTRVPLIVRAPWLPSSVGARTAVLAELVDVFPTMAELADAPLDAATARSLDGVSLAPVLRNPGDEAAADRLKPFALSQYMRCPVDASVPQKANGCLFTDRSQIPFMGYTIRTKTHRYTQWAQWNGSRLGPTWWSEPRWPTLGEELYVHDGDNGFDFDAFENENCNASEPQTVTTLRALLHEAVANASARASRELMA